jgi:hypothetical protein
MGSELKTAVIKESNFTLEVSGYFEKGEEEIHYPVDRANPGSGDSFEINYVELTKGSLVDVLYWLDGKKNCIQQIEELCLDYLNDQ